MTSCIEIKQRNITVDTKDILEILEYEKDDIVFLSGSLIEGSINKLSEGMGNKLSDIDVFIISDDISKRDKDSAAYDRGRFQVQFNRLYGISIDIEIFSKEAVLTLMKELSDCTFDNNERTFNILSLPKGFELFKFTSFIHRFLNGVPIYNEEKFNTIAKDFKEESYYKLMTRIGINNVDMNYEDVTGNIEDNKAEVAVTVARTILLDTMKSYIFHKKTSLDRDKWIPLKLRNLAEDDKEASDVYSKFRKLYFEASLTDDKSLIRNAERILNFSNSIIDIIGQEGGV